jgi:hypothetical protein
MLNTLLLLTFVYFPGWIKTDRYRLAECRAVYRFRMKHEFTQLRHERTSRKLANYYLSGGVL